MTIFHVTLKRHVRVIHNSVHVVEQQTTSRLQPFLKFHWLSHIRGYNRTTHEGLLQ